MRTNRCRQFRAMLTSYVDNEASVPERLVVEDHLTGCDACRRRLWRERAVRERLQGWSAEARAQGEPLAWPLTSGSRQYPGPRGLLRVAVLASAAVVLGWVTWNRTRVETGTPLTARGLISDSRCAGGHVHAAAELMNMSGRDCVRRCVEMGAAYVFVSQGNVYTIRNQDLVELTRLAGQDVEIEGEVRQNLLMVSHVRPLAVSRSTSGRPIDLSFLPAGDTVSRDRPRADGGRQGSRWPALPGA